MQKAKAVGINMALIIQSEDFHILDSQQVFTQKLFYAKNCSRNLKLIKQ